MRQKGSILVVILFGTLVVIAGGLGTAYYLQFSIPDLTTQKGLSFALPISQATIVPTKPPFPYERPIIPVKRSYLTVLVGDSIVAALGKNANQLRLDLISRYPSHEFVNYNYGFGATNILSLPERLNKETTHLGETFPPIMTQGFDLIIFESFAYNPLSQFPVEEGLKKQTEILDQSIKQMILKEPQPVVAILVPIAPSVELFAKGVYDLAPEVRKQWVEERVAYINNAIVFAQKNNIPLINVYQKSLTAQGIANLDYIDKSDYIHPSEAGIRLMTETIADFIYKNQIFPD